MFPFSSHDCEDCVPAYAKEQGSLTLHPIIALSSLPFLITFLAVAVLAWRKLFPLLSGKIPQGHDSPNPSRQRNALPAIRLARPSLNFSSNWSKLTLDRLAALTFSTTIALSAVLAELIFCEISGIVNPDARRVALDATIRVLVVLLVLVTPALEIHSITSASGFFGYGVARFWLGLCLDVVGYAIWLMGFWWIGHAVLGEAHTDQYRSERGLSRGSLERIGIIGISLMGSLAGFAAVSSLWQTFGVSPRKVTETDLARKQAGLDATSDMLAAKENRLRSLERKVSDAPQGSFFSRLAGTFRGDSDAQELDSLRMEMDGLATMQNTLANSLNLLQSRRAAQQQASTPYGRVCLSASYIFALYCLYRIGATTSAMLRRWWSPNTSFATTDPINNVLALVARHWDPSIDRTAWARQISFLLAGVMLLASFNAVLQTVMLFSRFTPAKLFQSAQQNLALLVSQISATYVVSSALLLRSSLPQDMGNVIAGALGGAPLDPGFVERWFESFFLTACALTVVGIWVGRKIVGSGDLDDDYYSLEEAGLEGGKLS